MSKRDEVSEEMLQRFKDAYIATMLWSSDDNGESIDMTHDASDLAPSALERINTDCAAFYSRFAHLIGDDVEQAGHDFWLTRAGHGAGFWDGDWPEDAAAILTEACDWRGPFGELSPIVGDDGKIYLE